MLEGTTFSRWIKGSLAVTLLALLFGVISLYENASCQQRGANGTAALEPQGVAGPMPSLTDAESTWLREHPVIRVVQDPSWPPLEFDDDQGQPSGVSNDYLELIEQRLKVKFEKVRGLTWQESYARLKRWDIDMTTCVAVTKERSEFWAFTKPYISIPIVILTRANVTYIGDMRELNGNRVAVVSGYVSGEWIRRDYPEIRLVEVNSVKEGLELLQRGQVFAFVDNMLVVGYYLAKLKVVDLKIAGATPYINAQCMAVRKDWAILAGILQKALDSVSDSERARIYQKWVPLRYEHGFDYKLFWQALAIVAVILASLLVWNRKLSREVKRRKEAEVALGASELRYRTVLKTAMDGFWFVDSTGRILDVNEAYSRIAGFGREELLKMSIADLEVIETRENVEQHIRQVFLEGASRFETAHRRKDGGRVQVEMAVQPLLEEGGRLFAFIRDISERKRAEEELRRAHRALMTLSECNKALARAGDEGELLHDVCRIVVESGGYVFAWIGLAETDEKRSVRPVAHAGQDQGYLDRIIVAWDGAKEGSGPTGTCIRTGEPVIQHNIANGQDYDLWREEALKRGFASSIALPLKENGSVLGALNIYAAESNAFAREEEKLLSELGEDISFGISSLRTKRKLEVSEERLRMALMASQQGFYDVNVVTGHAVVSPEYAVMLGYEPSEFSETTQKWLERTHPDDRDRIAASYRSYIEGKVENYQVEFRQRTKTGAWKWILSLGKIVARNPDGSPLRMVGTHLDITARKQVEEELYQKTEVLRSVFEASPLAIIALDREGIVTMWNPAAERMFGWTADEALGCVNPIVPEDRRHEFQGLRDRVLRGDSFSGVELTRRKKDGTAIEISLSTAPLKAPDGEVVGISSVSIDITARKRSEEAQKRLATAIEQSIESIMMTDRTGAIMYVNPAFEQISGYPREEVIGRNTRFLKSGSHDKSHYQDLIDALKGGKSWKGRIASQTKDGKIIYEDVSISPVRDSSGQIVGFVDVAHDVTEHMELEKQLIQAQKMESIGILAGGVAHDFNNLLQIVLGYSEFMLMDERLEPRVRDDLGKINQAARTGADLVRTLLTFSRKTETKPRPLNLNHQIDRVRKLLSRTVPKMIEIQLDLCGDLPAINADPTQIEQILMNLAINARDAMPDGGKILITTHKATLDDDYCRTRPGSTPGDYVLLQFSDTGQGMDRETLEHIFEPFYTTKGPGEGTGLGLAVVYGAVKQHGGYITCQSEPGGGTVFKIFFPAEPSYSETAGDMSKPSLPGGTETILLVDDEVFIRDLGERILDRVGYTVIAAGNGKEALELFSGKRNEIDLVILDLIMPEMGGKQCLEEILRICPHAKVLIASGYSVYGPAKESVGPGAKGFVTKPYDMSQMLQIVRDVLDGK